jgi:hypothetical protein
MIVVMLTTQRDDVQVKGMQAGACQREQPNWGTCQLGDDLEQRQQQQQIESCK